MRASECITTDVRITGPDDTIRQVAMAMAELDAGVLPVGENDRLIGMVTDRDIVVRGVAEGKGPDTKVRDVMSREVRYCYDDETIDDVVRTMADLQVRRLPVLNHDKRLVGIVSLGDFATSGMVTGAGNALSGISRPGGEHSQTH